MVDFYQINTSTEYPLLEKLNIKNQGTARALGFLDELANALKTSKFASAVDLKDLNEAVSTVQARVERRHFYTLMSWIPFTSANSISKLITQIKAEARSIKQKRDKEKSRIDELIKEAQENNTDCNKCFVPNTKLVDFIEHSVQLDKEESIPSNCLENTTILYYFTLAQSDEFLKFDYCYNYINRKNRAVPFFVKFDSKYRFIQILDPNEILPDGKNLQKTYLDAFNEITKIRKKDIFNKLIEFE